MVDRSDWTVRSKKNPYFAKEKHIRLAKGQITKSLVDFSLVPPIITATIQPALAPLLAGDTIEDALSADIGQTSNYTSTEGTITSVTVDVLVNGETPAALDIPLDWQDEVSVTVTVQDDASNERVFGLARTVGALAPDPFGPADWAVVVGEEVSVNILTLPNDNGAPITDIEYRVNGGTAISLGETTTGSYEIAAELEDEIQIRAVNAIGAGDWSDTKVVPSAEAWEQILDTVAAIDPDATVYDPGNPNTISLRVDGDDEFVEEIADGMSKRGALAQGSASFQPKFVSEGFGSLSAMSFDSDLLLTPNAEFANISPPFTRVMLLKADSTSSVSRIWNGTVSASELPRFALSSGNFRISNGINLDSTVSPGSDSLVVTTVFDDGDESAIRINGSTIISGDAGASEDHSGNAVGFRGDTGGSGWTGLIGPCIIFKGKDPADIKAVENLLHTLSGIPEGSP